MTLNGTTYHDNTPATVAAALENVRKSGARVRLFYGDRATGYVWDEERGVTGRVGRSMGPVQVPILVARAGSLGGRPILDHCVLRIIAGGREVYRAPNYQQPAYRIADEPSGYPEWPVKVIRDDYQGRGSANVANFKTRAQAERWVHFMTGARMSR